MDRDGPGHVCLEVRFLGGRHHSADRFLLTPLTVAAWMARIDEEGPNALLRLQEPVNKFPDLVRYIVRRLKLLCPRLGKVKIAEMLCRAGLHLAPTTVGRMLQEEPMRLEPIAAVPRALPQKWPFCWWVAVVVDQFSRRVQGFQVSAQKPDARALCAFLGRTIAKVGAPRRLISDKESMFTSDGFRGWCKKRGIGLRYGAVGKHGSITVVERFIRSMKHECTRRILVPLRRERVRREVAVYVAWYNLHRPHGALGVRTPNEVYKRLVPACAKHRLELRNRWPVDSKCAAPQAPMDRDGPNDVRLAVSFLGR